MLLSLAIPRRLRYFAAIGIALIVAAPFNLFPGDRALSSRHSWFPDWEWIVALAYGIN